MLMRVLKSLNKKMFELIRTLPLLSRISLIPYAEISMDSFTNAFIRPGQGSFGSPFFREQHKYCSQAIWKDDTVKILPVISVYYLNLKNVDT